MKKNDKYNQLVAKLNKCSQIYHNEDAMIISDEEYDQLYRELVAMEKRDPSIIVPESPTQRIGEPPVKGFKRVTHHGIMYSLDNVFNTADLIRFWRRFDKLRTTMKMEDVNTFYCDYKMDGLACELVYVDGRLVLASTRGDGREGEDVTTNIMTLPDSLPKRIMTRAKIIVRGEVVVHRNDFNMINNTMKQLGRKPFADMRSYAAASLRQINPEITKQRNLRFYAYDAIIDTSNKPLTQVETIRLLKWCGFSTPKGVLCSSVDEIEAFARETYAARSKLLFNIDGIVIKQNNPACRKPIGWSKHAPLFNVAYKFAADTLETAVKSIQWKVGRTGKVTPVAVIEPSNFDGVMVTNVNLANAQFVECNKLGVGSIVSVSRSADVIPKISKVIESKNYQGLPKVCPSCGQPLILSKHDLVCGNATCQARRIANLEYIIKDILGVKGIGEKACAELVNKGSITNLSDLFIPINNQTSVSQDLLDIVVTKARSISLAELISMLGIPGVGLTTARKIIYEAPTLSVLVDIFKSPEKVHQLALSTQLKEAICNWYTKEESKQLMDKLLGLKIAQWENL